MGTVVQVIEAPGGYNVGSVTAELYVASGTTQPPVWAFTNPGTNIAIKFPFRAINYGGGAVSIDIDWYSLSGSTSGTVTWDVSITSVAAGSAESIEGATATGTGFSTASTVNSTAKGLTRLSGGSISGANLDGMATGSDVWVEVKRNTGDTSLTGSAGLKAITISYGDGLTGTPGSGDVVGPSSATNNDIAAFDLTTGKLIKDSGVLVTSVVVGPASSTTTAIVKYNGTTGKLVQDSGITIDASNNVAGMGTLNTRTIANWVDGPASSTSGNVAQFSGTGGKLLADGGKLVSDLVTGPASSTSGNIVSFNGTTGKLGQDSGVSATAHSARHAPGGADSSSIFSGSFSTDDVPVWNGSAFAPKIRGKVLMLTADFTIAGSSLADVTGLTFSIPRAGTYYITFGCGYNVTSSGTVQLGANYTGTVTNISINGVISTPTASSFIYFASVTNNSGGTSSASTTGAHAGLMQVGLICSTTGTFSIRAARSGAAVMRAGSGFTIYEQ